MLRWFLTNGYAVNVLLGAILALFGVIIWIDTTLPSALTGILDELAYGALVSLMGWLLNKQRRYLTEAKS